MQPTAPRKREDVPFSWFVTCGMPTYATLANVRFDRIFREADAIIEAYETSNEKRRQQFEEE